MFTLWLITTRISQCEQGSKRCLYSASCVEENIFCPKSILCFKVFLFLILIHINSFVFSFFKLVFQATTGLQDTSGSVSFVKCSLTNKLHKWLNRAKDFSQPSESTARIPHIYFFPPCGTAAQRGPWPPHSWGFYITHNDASQSVGLLWTRHQRVAETSTWQLTTLTTDRHPCPRWDSKPQPQQANGRRPTP